jgi:hypothetical protein
LTTPSEWNFDQFTNRWLLKLKIPDSARDELKIVLAIHVKGNEIVKMVPRYRDRNLLKWDVVRVEELDVDDIIIPDRVRFFVMYDDLDYEMLSDYVRR